MDRLIQHPYEVGQRWKNEHFTVYVMAVNDDRKNGEGVAVTPGTICVTTDKPFPERKLDAADVSPAQMDNIVSVGGYVLQDVGWTEEFAAQKQAMQEARAASGAQPPAPVTPPPQSGLGALLSK